MKKVIRKVASGIVVLATVMTKVITVLFITKGLTSAGVRLKAENVADNLIDQISTFDVMDPTTGVVKDMVAAGNQIVVDRIAAETLVKKLVRDEKANTKLIRETINDNWLKTIKKKADGDVDLVFGIGCDVKGQGIQPDKTRFGKTWPDVYAINQNIPMELSLQLKCNDTLSKGKPYGAVSIGCFRQVGGVAPKRNNHPLAVKMDPFSKMLLKDTFIAGQEDLKVYYILYWLDSDGNKGPESPVYPYTVTS